VHSTRHHPCIAPCGMAAPVGVGQGSTLATRVTQAQITGRPSLAPLAKLCQHTLDTVKKGFAVSPDHAPCYQSPEAVLTRVLVDVLKETASAESLPWWTSGDQAEWACDILEHKVVRICCTDPGSKTGEVLRGAATTISAVLRSEGAPPLAANADEQGTSSPELETAKTPATVGVKDCTRTNATVAGAKTVTPANECTGVKVECKALDEEGTLVKGCVLSFKDGVLSFDDGVLSSPEAPGEDSTPSPVGEGLPPTHAAANSGKEGGSVEGN